VVGVNNNVLTLTNIRTNIMRSLAVSVSEHGFIETDTSELCRSCVRSHFYFPPLIAGCRSIRLQCLHVLVICSHHQMLPRFVLSGQKRRKTMDRFRSDVVLRRVVTCLTVRVRVHLSIFIAVVVVAIRELPARLRRRHRDGGPGPARWPARSPARSRYSATGKQ